MVEWAELRPGRRGAYYLATDRIELGQHLTRRQAAASLAHELGHRRFGDSCSTPPIERRAWEYGAAMLIAPTEYRAAESIVGPSPQSLAIELEVTPKLIEAWRRWWLRRGQFLEELDPVDTADGRPWDG